MTSQEILKKIKKTSTFQKHFVNETQFMKWIKDEQNSVFLLNFMGLFTELFENSSEFEQFEQQLTRGGNRLESTGVDWNHQSAGVSRLEKFLLP